MSDPNSIPDPDPATAAMPESGRGDELARAAAAGPPLAWDDAYADAGDGRAEGTEPDLINWIFREPPEFTEQRGE